MGAVTGDVEGKLRGLMDVLAKMRYPAELDSGGLRSGAPSAVLPVLLYCCCGYSSAVARWLSNRGHDLAARAANDARFAEAVLHAVCELGVAPRPRLSAAQLLASSGFAEAKLLLATGLGLAVRAKHAELAKREADAWSSPLFRPGASRARQAGLSRVSSAAPPSSRRRSAAAAAAAVDTPFSVLPANRLFCRVERAGVGERSAAHDDGFSTAASPAFLPPPPQQQLYVSQPLLPPPLQQPPSFGEAEGAALEGRVRAAEAQLARLADAVRALELRVDARDAAAAAAAAAAAQPPWPAAPPAAAAAAEPPSAGGSQRSATAPPDYASDAQFIEVMTRRFRETQALLRSVPEGAA